MIASVEAAQAEFEKASLEVTKAGDLVESMQKDLQCVVEGEKGRVGDLEMGWRSCRQTTSVVQGGNCRGGGETSARQCVPVCLCICYHVSF